MKEFRILEVKQSVFANNDKDADRLRQQLKEENTSPSTRIISVASVLKTAISSAPAA